MIDISQYRAQIGQFYLKVKAGKFLSYKKENNSGNQVLGNLKVVLKFSLLAVILIHGGGITTQSETEPAIHGQVQAQGWRDPEHLGGELEFRVVGKKQSSNFWAKYRNGNRGCEVGEI